VRRTRICRAGGGYALDASAAGHPRGREVDEDGSVGVDQLAVEVGVGGDVHGFPFGWLGGLAVG
jgi:hypothetical protein